MLHFLIFAEGGVLQLRSRKSAPRMTDSCFFDYRGEMGIESGIRAMQNREHACKIYMGCSKKGVVDSAIQIT